MRKSAPWLLGIGLVSLLAAPALNPDVQLYYRDTLRCAYHFKQFIAAQLARGASPFWDPWTESGTSVLSQVTPGLFHPLTLLYYALPFELAFKLNHLLALPLAFIATMLLSKKLGASPWASAAAACGYAGSGYLVSVTSSNLHYALGAATLPLALHALLRFVEAPRPLRLLWASTALALCLYGGEPQSMFLAGLIGSVWVVGTALQQRRAPARAAGAVALWGLCALFVAAPAALPVLYRVAHSPRVDKVGEDSVSFATAPTRLPGLLLPWAFDDAQESASLKLDTAFNEYFGGVRGDAFIDSIALGLPIFLLALVSRRRGLWALAGGLFLVAASTGNSFGIQRVLFAAIPGMKLFRYPEKLIGPGSLLLCLAAGLGADEALRAPRFLARLSAAAALVLVAARAALALTAGSVVASMMAHGQTHAEGPARWFVAALGNSLLAEAALCAALAALPLVQKAPLPALVCAAAAYLQSSGLLFTMPLEVVHAPLLLAQELKGIAGESENRWRLRAESDHVPVFSGFDLRIGRMVGAMQALDPMLHTLARIESATEYTALADREYEAAMWYAPQTVAQIMGVRFDVQVGVRDAEKLQAKGYQPGAFGALIKQFPERPRAFLASCAVAAPVLEEAVLQLMAPAFRAERAVVREELSLPCPAPPQGSATYERVAADRIRSTTEAAKPALLVVAEHFDPGWRATVDGAPARALQVDLMAIGVAVPAGKHTVELHFVPQYLWLGFALALSCAVALALLELLKRHHRVGAAEAK